MTDDRLIIIGVRHHSPACARLVQRVIERSRPAYVLVEGPVDFNAHIDDLKRTHKLPVAIFSYQADETSARASYSPFCDYSPEWQALQSAWAVGAHPLFCDLPAWHPDFGTRDNRYADPNGLHQRYGQVTAALEGTLSAEGADAVWDALAEQCDPARLGDALAQYFEALRPAGTEDAAEAAREDFMGRYAAWALRAAENRPVVLVCGGWHVNGIRARAAIADSVRPDLPADPEGTRTASYLTPFSYGRLDRFTGYASGMPSPAYYEQVYHSGLSAAADWAMDTITTALRKKQVAVSTADRIAWQANALLLARLRRHAIPLRTDILDAALTTLIKGPLAQAAPWTQSGEITRGADDVAVAMVNALSGTLEGKLAPGTRQPPLVADVERRMAECGLTPEAKARQVTLNWREPKDRPQARLLHQLRLLELPGIKRRAGPARADAREMNDTFEIVRDQHFTGALIEAARWGGELPMAASARLHAAVAAAAGDMAALASGLSDGLFAGLFASADALVSELAASVAACRDSGELGLAARLLVRLFRYGDIFGASAARAIAPVCEAMFAQALWLIEDVHGDAAARATLDAVIAVRDFAGDASGLNLDTQAASATFARVLANPATPPILAGAALGYLIARGEESAASSVVRARVLSVGSPEKLGDFLAGLFALAREAMRGADEALAAVDTLVAGWADDEFLVALPAMRGAFEWFPPKEREALARRILEQAGYDLASARTAAAAWMRSPVPIPDQAAAMALEARVAARLARYGLT
jgi:Family of unknown function (DUF5682)